MLRSIRHFFRSLFVRRGASRAEDAEEAFEPIDIERLAYELQLDSRAERFGSKDLPGSNDTARDAAHTEIEEEIASRVNRAFRRANRALRGIEAALPARSIRATVEEALQIPDREVQALRVEDASLRRKERGASAERDEALERIRRYRTRFGLERGPRLREESEKRVRLRMALTLGVIQAGANAFFFVQGVPYGWLAALSLAFGLGAFDIFAHVAAGRVASRVQAPDLGNLGLGLVFTLLFVASVPFYNFGIVHLRNGIRTLGFTAGYENWWPNLVADPFGFSDFGSFVLLAIGLVCSSMAVAAGWAWDEPIPALRNAAEQLRNANEELAWNERQRLGLRSAYAGRARHALGERLEEIDRDWRAAEALVGRAKALRENLHAFVRDAERAHDALVQRYRDENRLHRTTPPPAYFDEAPSLSLERPIELETTRIEAILDEERRLKRDFEAGLPALQAAIDALRAEDDVPTPGPAVAGGGADD